MFERFTDSSRQVVVRAQVEARMLNHNYIGTEHLLLGLCHDGQSAAATALAELGFSLDAVRRQVEQTVGHGQEAPGGHIPFTVRCKRALQYALEESVQLADRAINSHHILLGLLRQEESTAVVIVALGSSAERVRSQVFDAAVRNGETAESRFGPDTAVRPGEDERLRRSRRLYVDAVFGGDMTAAADASRALDGVEADLALSRGRIAHAHSYATARSRVRSWRRSSGPPSCYRGLGDARGEGEALLWIGVYHQVVQADDEAAMPYLQRSYVLAGEADDPITMSYAVRHLGFADMNESRWDDARAKLEESVRLRRQIGFAPGVAAGLLALAELSTAAGQLAEADRLFDEATEVATRCHAHGVLAWIEEARRADPQSQ